MKEDENSKIEGGLTRRDALKSLGAATASIAGMAVGATPNVLAADEQPETCAFAAHPDRRHRISWIDRWLLAGREVQRLYHTMQLSRCQEKQP